MGRDTGIGIGLLGLCGLLYWQAGFAPAPPFVSIGPAFYPRVISLVLALLAVWLIAEDVFRKSGAAGKKGGGKANYERVVLAFFIFLGYVIGISFLGYVTATFLFVLALSWSIGPRRWGDMPKLLAVAAGTAVITFLVFEKYLYVFLPRGLLF